LYLKSKKHYLNKKQFNYREAWDFSKNHKKSLFFTTYEEMQSNLDEVLKKLMLFLNVNLSQEELQKLKENVTLDSFKVSLPWSKV